MYTNANGAKKVQEIGQDYAVKHTKGTLYQKHKESFDRHIKKKCLFNLCNAVCFKCSIQTFLLYVLET